MLFMCSHQQRLMQTILNAYMLAVHQDDVDSVPVTNRVSYSVEFQTLLAS